MSASTRTAAFIFILCAVASLGAELLSHRSAVDAAVSAVEREITLAIAQDEVASLEANAKTLSLVSHGRILMLAENGRRFAYPSEAAETCVFPFSRNLSLYGQNVGQLFICNSVKQFLTEVISFPRLLSLAVLAGLSLATLALLPGRLHRRVLGNLLAKVEENLASQRGALTPVSKRQGQEGMERRPLTIEAISSKLSELFEAFERGRRQLEVEHATTAAIARTTQSLAHDVRKPFSMFKSIIQVVEATEDPNEVREVLKLTLPEVNQAMASVEGMIQDVMQIGSETKLHMEDAAPESLIEAALGELFHVYRDAEVALSYALSHRHMVKADSVRLGRVFANILGNAVQAMDEKGALWIRTTERNGFVKFTLGNGGSLIPPESLPKLFDAFFTSGKKSGTGLGLAIAKKIVEAHGGKIHCVSEKNAEHPNGMVEFIFTLPAANALSQPRTDALPRSSRDIQAALAAVRIAAARHGGAGPDPREAESEMAILARLARLEAMGTALPDPVTVLVVDDEAVYRNGLLSLLAQSDALAARVRLVFAKNDEEAFAAASAARPILLIEDVDLGPRSKDGLEIVKTLRANGFEGHVCVHSNRFLAGDNRAALAAGADTVLPKPMGRAHFLKLILASLPEASPTPNVLAAAILEPRKLSVAMLDDSISMRMAWKMQLGKETDYRHFASSTAFFETCAQDPAYLSSLDVVITDYNFAPGDPHNGGTLARDLRESNFQGLILRCSGEANLGEEIEALFDGDMGKTALKYTDFKFAVDQARGRHKPAMATKNCDVPQPSES